MQVKRRRQTSSASAAIWEFQDRAPRGPGMAPNHCRDASGMARRRGRDAAGREELTGADARSFLCVG
eukprot:2883502-Pyramimonas_sp.AAC.1